MNRRFASGLYRGLQCCLILVLVLSAARTLRADDQPPAQSAPPPPKKFGDFTVLGSTTAGKTLCIKLPGAQTLVAVITQTNDALAKVCDARPTLTGAFADSQNKNKGGASFTAKLKGYDVRGLMFSGVAPEGGSSTVILTLATATSEQVNALMGFMPIELKLKTYTFPDNSGSIGLPDGWTTPSTSATWGVLVRGPQGQGVVLGAIRNINTMNSMLVRQANQVYQMQLQNYQTQLRQYQQMVMMHEQNPNIPLLGKPPEKPTPPDPDPNVQFPQLDFCPECHGAAEVFKYYYPITEAKARRRGKGYSHLEQVMEIVPAAPNPYERGSKADVAYFRVTDYDASGKATPIRVINRIATAPIIEGESWQLGMTIMRAPDAIFDRDIPVMNAIVNSETMNMDVVNSQIQAAGEQVRKMGQEAEQRLLEQGREFREQQQDQFNRFEEQMAAQEQARHDFTSDFIEYISNVRRVYDNQTGETGEVPLLNSGDIVDDMNKETGDPSRFVQIPLRELR